ncbi:MAG: hypothetical protein OEN01_07170 [Candidatus Krumholzibacteria bacterium]|nr:hypothetical protein [Candidatus Krumholzibacteria bacterium]
MGHTGRKTAVFAAGIVLLVVVGGLVYVDAIAKRAIEGGSRRAFGVDTSVGTVKIGFLSGRFGLATFRVDNPDGFDSKEFFVVEKGDISVGGRALLSDTVVVDRFTLDGIAINLELQGRKSNYGVILDNLKRFESSHSSDGDDEPRKQFIINDLHIRDVIARVRVGSPQIGLQKEMEVKVPEIHLKGVGGQRGGVELAQIASIIVTRVLEGVVRSRENLPAELRAGLRSEISSLIKGQRDVVVSVESLTQDSAKETVEKLVDTAKDKLGKLLGGDDEEN